MACRLHLDHIASVSENDHGETALEAIPDRRVVFRALEFRDLRRLRGSATGYDRGYREGVQQGEQDGRQGREPQVERNSVYRDADLGYQGRYGSRDAYRDDFRRGFASGYRTGYERVRVDVFAQGRRDNRRDPRVLRGYQDPAFARGYSDGWERGADDGRDHDRYDPSATATIATAMMATRGPTARRTRTRTTIAPASGRGTKKATAAERVIAGSSAAIWPRAGRSG